MNLKVKSIFLMVAFLATTFSCAVDNGVETSHLEVESLRDWMAANETGYEEVEDGLFLKITKGGNTQGLTPDSIADWVTLNCIGTDLDGNYFVNTYKPIAKHLGTFSYSTHFVPRFLNYAYYSSSLMAPGVAYALGEMQESDSVDIVMTSAWSYGLQAPSIGFAGELFYNQEGVMQIVPPPSNRPLRMSVGFKSMTDKPYLKGDNDVINYAREKLHLGYSDTITTGLYYKIIDAKPKGDTISADTTISLQYTGALLDGFVFDTNVEEVAKENHIIKSSFDLMSFKYSAKATVDGFNEVVKKMRVGETAITVFTSEYGYGKLGDGEIQPYDPLVFKIKVMTAEEIEELNK